MFKHTSSTPIPPSDIPAALTATAFAGIAWYIALELNIRLLFNFTRISLYFWSVLLCSWGITLNNLAITLYDFGVWTRYFAVVFIALTWALYVVSQSLILYSRLEMVVRNRSTVGWVLKMVVCTSVVFGAGTVGFGCVARYPTFYDRLESLNLIWDKVQLAAFFLQETLISLLYIYETHRCLRERTLLIPSFICSRSQTSLLQQLIYVNVFIICLDCCMLALSYAGFFSL
ncbi:hypothetical protein CC80DRAFT_554001 [Byssothecium circinans]|uniref:DUF7703 domain-containing protein n=1 Tax=Byssothecium circinans TaxID=147558 RepID=A0A6A5TE14_9PLEO|nr:hypothetical protein CC80DRAFT_583211 [Byssothecium circinans]KAF1950851.1 hypothetical protein CC80DRAFT_554001 [Byssothecium circinans]